MCMWPIQFDWIFLQYLLSTVSSSISFANMNYFDLSWFCFKDEYWTAWHLKAHFKVSHAIMGSAVPMLCWEKVSYKFFYPGLKTSCYPIGFDKNMCVDVTAFPVHLGAWPSWQNSLLCVCVCVCICVCAQMIRGLCEHAEHYICPLCSSIT
jgi:hypothetical protein